MTKSILTQEELKSKLHYNPDNGIFTRIQSTQSIRAGDIAGSKSNQGYLQIRINCKQYQAHRLAWLYVYGEMPNGMIDHINGVKDDNRIKNLRESTSQQNQFNTGSYKNNKSGYKGVSFHKSSNKWSAKATLNGKGKHLGLFTTPELASQAYKVFATKHHAEFYRAA